ncbi:MAG: hypothetical protein LBG13_02725 [Holosporales bacterium]|jgi:hypothetical protein|nr:hypothetical protein [Holosporales bacterium]
MSQIESVILYGRNNSVNLGRAYDLAIQIIGRDGERYIRNSYHPDFLLVRKEHDENDIPIEKTRYINEFLSIRSDVSGKRVVIIENAEGMNKNAANALLKTLEAPPGGSAIILTTNKLFSILSTIRSRCQKIFINAPKEKEYGSDDPFLQRCLDFFDKGCRNLPSFVKLVNKDEVSKFLDIAITYSYCRCLRSPSVDDAQRHLDLLDFAEKSKNAHLDPYNLVAACCCFIAQ